MCVAVAVPLAIRQALVSARKDSDSKADSWVAFRKIQTEIVLLFLLLIFFFDFLEGPTTVDATLQYSIPNYSQYKLK